MHSQASGHTGGPARPTVSVTMVASVPDEANVRDFDQLSPAAMDAFPALVAAGRTSVPSATARALESGEIINYTGFYRVDIEE